MLRWFSIAMTASLLMPLAACVPVPFLNQSMDRAAHEHRRRQPDFEAYFQRHLEGATCMKLREWEAAVLRATRIQEAIPGFGDLSIAVLRDDLARLRSTMAAKNCPSRDALLAAGVTPPTTPTTLAFACVCWQPYAYSSMAEMGNGPAGPDCVTVRAELSRGSFVFQERVPIWGERRHAITYKTSSYFLQTPFDRNQTPAGSLERETVRNLIYSHARVEAGWTNLDTDGWLETGFGSIRILADDCSVLAPETASTVERTIIRWIEAPPN